MGMEMALAVDRLELEAVSLIGKRTFTFKYVSHVHDAGPAARAGGELAACAIVAI
jgi:hypothetical protein